MNRRFGLVLLALFLLLVAFFAWQFWPSHPKADFTNKIGMAFVEIPAGRFVMGYSTECPEDNPFTEKQEQRDCLQGHHNELPRHEVTIKQAFYLSQFEVSQEQWHAVMANNPAYFKTEKVGESSRHYPVERIAWDDAQAFIMKLNALEDGHTYRLPSEAEWEYAARAGSTTAYPWGDEIEVNRANCAGCASPWDARRTTAPIGSFAANAWGLFDMHGNVEEWVADCQHDDYQGAPSDGSVWQTCFVDAEGHSFRVLRGGSWNSGPRKMRSAARTANHPQFRNAFTGFRVVLEKP